MVLCWVFHEDRGILKFVAVKENLTSNVSSSVYCVVLLQGTIVMKLKQFSRMT